MGTVPLVGMAADLLNAGWYAAEGDYNTAGLSVGAIFGASAAVLAVKYGGTATKVVTKMASKGFKKAASRVKKYFGLTDEVLSSADDVAKQADEVVEGVAKSGVSYADVLSSASSAYKGSTVLGHGLSKHAGRHPEIWGKLTGNPSTWHTQALKHFDDIMNGPGDFIKITTDQGVNFLEKRLIDGRGIRLNMDGTFKGFID